MLIGNVISPNGVAVYEFMLSYTYNYRDDYNIITCLFNKEIGNEESTFYVEGVCYTLREFYEYLMRYKNSIDNIVTYRFESGVYYTSSFILVQSSYIDIQLSKIIKLKKSEGIESHQLLAICPMFIVDHNNRVVPMIRWLQNYVNDLNTVTVMLHNHEKWDIEITNMKKFRELVARARLAGVC